MISEVEGAETEQRAMPEQAPSGAAAVEGGSAPTPEEQQWYDGVQKAAASILFTDDKASKTVLSMLNPKIPARSCGTVAAQVLIQVDQGMDGEVPESVILPASEEILEHVLDIAEAARILQRTPENEEEAAQAMMARLIDEYGIDEQDFQQAQAQVGQKVA